MSEHTPNDCQCGATALMAYGRYPKGTKDTFQCLCRGDCGRRGLLAFTSSEAIADWNRQTAAPDLLEVCKMVYAKMKSAPLEIIEALEGAITRAEPKP